LGAIRRSQAALPLASTSRQPVPNAGTPLRHVNLKFPVPTSEPKLSPAAGFARLVEIMAKLRAPGGCPWDREQTFDTIKPYLLEETYEVMDAIDARGLARARRRTGRLASPIRLLCPKWPPKKAASISPTRFTPSTAS